MSFPVSPPNGSTTIINNVVYVYNSSKGTWSRISSGQPQLAEYTDITATGTSTFAAVVLDSATVNTGIFWANGDPWASTGGTTYGDSNVAAYLPTYSGALSVGDVSISGNLFVNGNTTTLNANNITINDTVIYIANNNPANTYDIGLVGHFTAGIYQHTGIVRDHTNNAWTFFSNATVEPTGNVITLTGAIYDAVKLGSMTAVNGQITGYHTGAIGANTANSGVFTSVTTTSGGQLTGYHTGAIGANTANSGVFTTLTASSGYQGAASGALNGTLGATTPNSVVATSVTTTSGGQVTGYITGPIGANTANSGSFTTITASSTVNLGSISNITITGGTNGQYLQTDGSGHLSWTTGIVAGSLVDAPTIAWDVWTYPIASVTLGGNRTLAFPTGLSPGAYALYVTQPAVGGPYTLSFAAGYRFPSGAVPALSPTAGAVDILTFMARDSSHMDTVIQRDFV